MLILCWNCRRLGNPRTVQDLWLIVKEKKLIVVFLLETKITSVRFVYLKKVLGFDGCFVVESMERSGGLVLLWRIEVEIEIVNYSQRHINAWITNADERIKWLLNRSYGHPKVSKTKEAWHLMSYFKPLDHQGWCMIGDFNEFIS